jgi:hypothetical protein
MAPQSLSEFLSEPLWIAVVAKGSHAGKSDFDRNLPLLRQRFFAQQGFFSERIQTDTEERHPIWECFSQKHLSFECPESCLLVAVLVSHDELFSQKSGTRVLYLPEGGVIPKSGSIVFPPGSLLLREPLSPSCARCSDLALHATPVQLAQPNGWKRRHHLYQDTNRPFDPTAIVYRDLNDRVCFVLENRLTMQGYALC